MSPQLMQQLVVFAIVLAAAAYLGRKAWRQLRRPARGCDSDCGCGH